MEVFDKTEMTAMRVISVDEMVCMGNIMAIESITYITPCLWSKRVYYAAVI